MRGDDARQFDHLHAGVAPTLVIEHGQTVSVTQPRSLVPPQTVAEDAAKLPSESSPEEVVRDEVDRRVENDEEVARLVKRVQWQALERLRVLLEGPDDARDQRGRLAQEEDDDDADEHHRGVIALAFLHIDLLAAMARHAHGVHQ